MTKIHYKEIPYGFEYGAATVERHMSDTSKGWVVMGIKTPKIELQIYITKTGQVCISEYGKEVIWQSNPKKVKK